MRSVRWVHVASMAIMVPPDTADITGSVEATSGTELLGLSDKEMAHTVAGEISDPLSSLTPCTIG